MSKVFDAANHALKVHPNDIESAVDLFIDFIGMDECDFTYEFSQAPEEYLKAHRRKIELTCTRCNEIQELHCRIVYSQGYRVCVDCKKITQESDNAAFDRDMASRIF